MENWERISRNERVLHSVCFTFFSSLHFRFHFWSFDTFHRDEKYTKINLFLFYCSNISKLINYPIMDQNALKYSMEKEIFIKNPRYFLPFYKSQLYQYFCQTPTNLAENLLKYFTI